MSNPLVSVCIPVFNMVATLEQSVGSVLAQTFQNWELLIVDNASDDGSADLALKLAATDSRIRVHHNPATVPMVENYNICLKHASGKHINILSADDLLLPAFLQECLAVFSKNQQLGYVACARRLINENGAISDQPAFYRESGIIQGDAEARVNLAGNHSTPSCMLYNRQALLGVAGFPDRFPFCFDIFTKLKLNLAHDIAYLATPLCVYRVSSESGPSLYRVDDLSPLFELYQIKRSILGSMKIKEEEYSALSRRVYRNISKVSLQLADFCSKTGKDPAEVHRYLFFARGFFPEISQTAVFQKLLKITEESPELPIGDQSRSNLMGSPYDLPQGSIVLP